MDYVVKALNYIYYPQFEYRTLFTTGYAQNLLFIVGGKPVTRHLSLKEKASRAEALMNQDIASGRFSPSPYAKYIILMFYAVSVN